MINGKLTNETMLSKMKVPKCLIIVIHVVFSSI